MISVRCNTKQQQRICYCSEEGNVNRHPGRMGRICVRGEESGKKIKAISCELLAVSCELKAEAYDFR